MILMNEREFIKNLLEEKPVLTHKINKGHIMKMLSGYYNNDMGHYDDIVAYMKIFFPEDFFVEKYGGMLKDIIRNCAKKNFQLKEVDKIDIYESELQALEKIEDDTLKKILFVCIVIAKLRDNNGWLGLYEIQDVIDLFKFANISVQETGANERYRYFGKLEKLGFLIGTKRVDSINEKVNILPEGKVEMTITSLENLGNQYLITTKNKDRIMCKRCGRIVKKTGNKKQFCGWCLAKNSSENKKKYRERQKLKNSNESTIK